MNPLDACDRVLDLVRATAGDTAEAQVTVTTGTSALTRFANSFIHQNVVDNSVDLTVKVTIDGQSASATATGAESEALGRAVRAAVEASRVQPPDPAWPGLAPPSGPAPAGSWDEQTAAATPAVRAGLVAEFVQAVAGLEAAGYCETTALQAAYANTAGQRLEGRSSTATLDGIARAPASDGSARQMSAAVGDLRGADAGAAAARLARSGTDPIDLEPGSYEVVLGPGCVGDLMLFLGFYGFNGRAVAEGRSFAQVGEARFDPSVSIWDDATGLGAVGLPFDAEGTAKRRVDFVADGTICGLAHDRRTAAAAGVQSTGHAIEGGESFGGVPSSLFLRPDAATAEDLVGRMEHGLLVTDFWYTRVLDPRTLVTTGLTRNGVFLVENGHVVRPVGNLRFTQSYVEALAPGNVLGIASDAQLTPMFFGTCTAPTIHLASWHFTGGASG
ncbi:MAG: TldD/PmbA family protein [Frankiaceae bacterium]